MISLSPRNHSKYYLDAVSTVDFQYANYELFHVAHDKAILEATLQDNRGHAVAEAGGVHQYLADRSLTSLNHNNSLGGFFFEHEFPYYSNDTAPGPLNHRFIDRVGSDGQTYQDYAGHNWHNFQHKLLSDHQAHKFTITDDFYRWIQKHHPSFLEEHDNIHSASHELGFSVDNKRLDHDIGEARNAVLHHGWFLNDLALTEGSVVASIVIVSLFVNKNFDHVGASLVRAGGQQGFVMGSEGLIDLLPQTGIGELTGHALIEGHNLEIYGGLSALYMAAELLCANRDLSRSRTYALISQRSQIVAAKVVVSKGVAILGAKIAGLTAKGATLGSLGPPGVGTIVGAGIGLAVGLGGGWWFAYKDQQAAEKHEEIFVDAVRNVLKAL